MRDTIAIYSGGMDSFTLVNALAAQGRLHSCLSFDYGQRHGKELTYARRVCEKLGVPHDVIPLTPLGQLLSGSALTDASVPLPLGHYQEESMKATVVPNRNMIMLAIAVGVAQARGCSRVAYGAHSGDHAIYPDCREAFVEALSRVVELSGWSHQTVELFTPYLHLDKYQILKIGQGLGLDYAASWTCYAGREKACGKCGSCQERLEAFEMLGTPDPLEYEDAV